MASVSPDWPRADHVRLILRQHPLTGRSQRDAQPLVTIDGVAKHVGWGETVLPYWDSAALSIEIEVPNYVPGRHWRARIGRKVVTMPAGALRQIEYIAPPNEFGRGQVGAPGIAPKGYAAAIVPRVVIGILIAATAAAILFSVVAVLARG